MATKLEELQGALIGTTEPLDPTVIAVVTAWFEKLGIALIGNVPTFAGRVAGPHVAAFSTGVSLPAAPDAVLGHFFWNSATSKLHFFNGAAWQEVTLS